MEPLTIFGAIGGASEVSKEVTNVLSRVAAATRDLPEAVDAVHHKVDSMNMSLGSIGMHITAKSAATLRTPSHLMIEDLRIVMEACVRTLDKLRSLVAPMVHIANGVSASLIQQLRSSWSNKQQAGYYINHLHRLQQCLGSVVTILNK